jgi:dTDP-4-dehydrorhamnose 3,5-epimerase
MEYESTSIPGLVRFRPTPHHDERGFFSRTFDVEVARRAGIDPHAFVQDSVSRSRRGVVRGLHVRSGAGEGKLVRCSFGRIFDVVVDLRPGSPAYLSWLSFDLDGDEQSSIFIPPGCAHGFQALTETTDISYRIDQPHDPVSNLTIAHDDPRLAIPWPLEVTAMSEVDRHAPRLAELGDRLREIRPFGSPTLCT